MSGIDPMASLVFSGSHYRDLRRMSDIERRVIALERARPTMQQGTGTPTTAPRDGTAAMDTNGRLLARINGQWAPLPVSERGQVTLTWSASTVSGTATVGHGLGFTPAAVLLTVNMSSLLVSPLTPVAANFTATTFQAYCISGVSGSYSVTFSWHAIA